MNEVKPRFDGKGSEFGLAHRDLPKKCGMFDVDMMNAQAVLNLTLRQPDECFFEYNTDFKNSEIIVKAMFEIKYKNSCYVEENMKLKVGTSLWAETQIAKKLNCRFFLLIATNGRQPYKVYELIDKEFVLLGELSYNGQDRKEKINEFWERIGLLDD